jgi:hypothetical protein
MADERMKYLDILKVEPPCRLLDSLEEREWGAVSAFSLALWGAAVPSPKALGVSSA